MRKEFIVDWALDIVEFMRIMMGWSADKGRGILLDDEESDADNFCKNSISGVMKRIKAIVRRCFFETDSGGWRDILGNLVVNNLKKFRKISQATIANRYGSDMDNMKEKVYTRNLFGRD